jgi:hypothetical protein
MRRWLHLSLPGFQPFENFFGGNVPAYSGNQPLLERVMPKRKVDYHSLARKRGSLDSKCCPTDLSIGHLDSRHQAQCLHINRVLNKVRRLRISFDMKIRITTTTSASFV